jgi:hypothetical protein
MGITEGSPEERETSSQLSASEKAALALENHLKKDIPFGGAKYQAFFDYFDQFCAGRKLESLRYEMKLVKKQDDITDTSSELRVAENDISNIAMQIEQKNISIPGYYDALVEIIGLTADLNGYLREEYKSKFPNFNKKDLNCFAGGEIEYVLVGIRADLLLRNFKERSNIKYEHDIDDDENYRDPRQ